MATPARALSGKRREVASGWFKQMLDANAQKGMGDAAAAAWLGTIFALRTAARLDGNKEWGRVGDDMITTLENAYLAHMGKEGERHIEVTRRQLQYDKVPDFHVEQVKLPKPIVTKTMAAVQKKGGLKAMKKASAKPMARPMAKPMARPVARPVVKKASKRR